MTKETSKNIRPEVGKQETANKLSDAEKLRLATGKQGVLDASHYIRMERYRDHTFRWEHHNTGDVDKALDLGMQLVARRQDRIRHKGINGENVSEWECKTVGSLDGQPLVAYLLVIPDDEYQKYFIDPITQKNLSIQEAMGRAEISREDAAVGRGLKTYAAKINDDGTDSPNFNSII